MQNLIIYRPWWLRGTGSMESRMLKGREPGESPKMCCLGQLAVSCGVDTGGIEEIGSPMTMRSVDARMLPEPLQPLDLDRPRRDNTTLTWKIVQANDNKDLPDEERERELNELFSEAGIAVTFTDMLPTYLAHTFPAACKSS